MSGPVSQRARIGGIRPAAVSAASGSAVVTALTMANAPWVAVVLTVLATLVVSLVLGLAKIVIPEESEHKRDLLLAWIRHRERRAELHERRPGPQPAANPGTGGARRRRRPGAGTIEDRDDVRSEERTRPGAAGGR